MLMLSLVFAGGFVSQISTGITRHSTPKDGGKDRMVFSRKIMQLHNLGSPLQISPKTSPAVVRLSKFRDLFQRKTQFIGLHIHVELLKLRRIVTFKLRGCLKQVGSGSGQE